MRCDSAGASHDFLAHVVAQQWRFSVGFPLYEAVKAAIRATRRRGARIPRAGAERPLASSGSLVVRIASTPTRPHLGIDLPCSGEASCGPFVLAPQAAEHLPSDDSG